MFARGFGSGNLGRTGWFRLGQLEVTTTALLVMLSAATMLIWVVDMRVLDPLVFDAEAVRQEGEVWRIVTWPIGEGLSIFGVIGLAFFWFVGHMVEDRTSRKRYAVLIALMVIVPAALVSLTAITAVSGYAGGLGTLGLALLVVIAVDEPQLPMLFGIPIWVIAAVVVGVNALSAVAVRAWGVLLLLIGAIVIALVGTAMIGAISAFPGVKRLKDVPGPRSKGAGKRRLGGRRKGGPATVTQGPWSSAGGFTPPSGGPTRLEQAELDVLLDKIGQSGIGSLSKPERERLDELSRKMREG